jgi:hypothetical protein
LTVTATRKSKSTKYVQYSIDYWVIWQGLRYIFYTGPLLLSLRSCVRSVQPL